MDLVVLRAYNNLFIWEGVLMGMAWEGVLIEKLVFHKLFSKWERLQLLL